MERRPSREEAKPRISSVQLKENFALSAESRRTDSLKILFLHIFLLQKQYLSAEMGLLSAEGFLQNTLSDDH